MRIVLLLLALLVAGCASMSKDQCLHADWYAVGVEDGAKGLPLERLGEHRQACAEYGVAPNAESYMAGRREGLMAFCTYDRGVAEGRAGRAYGSVCPQEVAADFREGYARGRARYGWPCEKPLACRSANGCISSSSMSSVARASRSSRPKPCSSPK